MESVQRRKPKERRILKGRIIIMHFIWYREEHFLPPQKNGCEKYIRCFNENEWDKY